MLAAFLAGAALCLPLDAQEVHIRWCVYRYGVDEGILRAVLQAENGPRGFEAGFNNAKVTSPYAGDPSGYCDPAMPDGCLQQARLSRRVVLHLQRWVFSDTKRREEWLWDFANDYHGAGAGKDWLGHTDKDYYNLLSATWQRQRALLRAHPRQGGYRPFGGVKE
jgi:hypothetical protein